MTQQYNYRITGDLKMADVVDLNQRLLLVIERFGISLGFGDKTIYEVSAQYKINPALLLLVMNVFNDHSFTVDGLVTPEYIPGLVEYLKRGHRYFLTEKLPYISQLIDRFIERTENPDTRLLRSFFQEYVNEVVEHMHLEEKTVFPYILEVFEQSGGKESKLLNYRIDDFVDNHTDIEEKLEDLKNLLIKHFPPTRDRFFRNQILLELYDLEYDLNDHNGVEERILAPLVRTLENKTRRHE